MNVICVYNDKKIFTKIVQNNQYLKDTEIFAFDNTTENIAITKRYNSFIDENVYKTPPTPNPPPQGGRENNYKQVLSVRGKGTKEDTWCVFIHQDFGIMEDLNPVLEKLNPDYIYGAVGVKIFKGFFYGKKGLDRRLGFKDELKITLGRILQGGGKCGGDFGDDFGLKKHGRIALFQPSVDAIDCCCIILHSSLIRKYDLKFDENLSFHMYAEELCYRAKHEHKIKTKVVQMKCFHLGKGDLGEEFEKSAQYVKAKFNLKSVPSTCYN